jgi:DNA-binding transcriptional LysR family regulator
MNAGRSRAQNQMAQQHFNDLLAFLAVARERSFTKASAKLGVAQSTLSHTIKRLESRMGIRLLTRTTRSAALMAFRDKPSGSLRITLSDHALRSFVWPKLRPVLKAYPDIKVEFSLDTSFRNIVEDGFQHSTIPTR